MATVPDTHTFVDGVQTSSEANTYIRDPLRFLQRPPIAELVQIVAQTFTTSVSAALTFTSETVDTDIDGIGGHDNSTNPSRYTARYPGWYEVSGGVGWASNAAGVRNCWWRVNGSDVNGSEVKTVAITGGTDSVLAARTKQLFLNVGDYVELFAIQTSGGNLNTIASTTECAHMSVRWVSN